jgi:hypothetical protein
MGETLTYRCLRRRSSGGLPLLHRGRWVCCILLVTVHLFVVATAWFTSPREEKSKSVVSTTTASQSQSAPASLDALLSSSDSTPIVCTDPVWCSVPMPKKSHFGFDVPTDPVRWKRAQALASSDRQILLEEIIKVFPHPLDFVDGDRSFRKIHYLVDIFVDKNKGLVDITSDSKLGVTGMVRRKLEAHQSVVSSLSEAFEHLGILDNSEQSRSEVQQTNSMHRGLQDAGAAEKEMQQGEIPDVYKYIPPNYDFRSQNRAPLIQLGFGVWKKDSNHYFSGNRLGYSGIDRAQFLKDWNAIKHKINTPFLVLCEGNENWGMLSTMFPNRTAGWGACCSTPKDRYLMDFLNHDKTLALLVNQHHNLTHHKVLSLPRGLPVTWAYTEKMVWDIQRFALKNIKKERLLFSAASSYGKSKCDRPRYGFNT